MTTPLASAHDSPSAHRPAHLPRTGFEAPFSLKSTAAGLLLWMRTLLPRTSSPRGSHPLKVSRRQSNVIAATGRVNTPTLLLRQRPPLRLRPKPNQNQANNIHQCHNRSGLGVTSAVLPD